MGNATATKILKAVPDTILLKHIPDEDPFLIKNYRKAKKKKVQKPDEETVFESVAENMTETLLVSDMEKSIKKYAELIGVNHESHVFRSKGVQRKLPEGPHDIQKVNAPHSRLKTF